MGKPLKKAKPSNSEVEGLKTKLADARAQAQEAETHASALKVQLETSEKKLKLENARGLQLEIEAKDIREKLSGLEAPESDFSLEKAQALLLELPADSGIKKALEALIESTVVNYHHAQKGRLEGGAPGLRFFELLTACADTKDSAYASLSVMHRAAATSFVGILKAAFA